MKKNSYITVTDQFCGAGGSSLGASKVLQPLGGEIKLALNHWKLAIETHNTNFPNTLHDCTDISACDPRRYPSTNILITSPECTNHTLAKGKKRASLQFDMFDCKIDESAERSRATMWDVPRFAEYHNYEIIIVENVVDARKWIQFPAWLHSMSLLGYNYKDIYINSMHCHPTPQSRDRMYVVFWKKGNKAPNLEFRPKGYCTKCGHDTETFQSFKKAKFGKFKQQYNFRCPIHGDIIEPYYFASYNAIDWSILGKKIGERNKPLSSNTIERIKYGLKKYSSNPFQVINYSPGYSKAITDEFGTITTSDHHAICNPFVINNQQSTGIGFRTKSVEEHLPTIATSHQLNLVTPFIIKQEHAFQLDYSKPVSEPFQTQTTRQSFALVTPKSFISSYYGNLTTNHITEPLGTCLTIDKHSLVSFENLNIEDCHYRMLKDYEIQAAMAFDADYKIMGDSRSKVKQLGNAVTPPVMEWLVSRAVESLL